ncbi:MAG: AMP-binding protein [Acetobacteraceae bacterium]|nr:AMP-binding protein [Acetobacteraceae bacterium]
MDLSDFIERNAAFTPGKVALRYEGQSLTYAVLAKRIAAAARALKSVAGVGRGDRVAILSTNHPDYLVSLYACARLGALLVPLNWRLAVPEQLFILADASPKLLLLQDGFDELLTQLNQRLPDIHVIRLAQEGPDTLEAVLQKGTGEDRNPHVDLTSPLLLVYTSGTTGHPKGAVLRQEALFWNAVMSQHMHDLTAADHVLTVLPLFHVGGLNILTTPALQVGASVTLHPRFAPDATLRAFTAGRPSLTVLVPATIQALIEHPLWSETDLASLRAVTTGSTQVPQNLIDALTTRGVPVLEVYGSTETAPIAIYTRIGGDLARKGSTGLPGLCCEARVVDEAGREVPHSIPGEVIVRGPNVFFEYWGNEGATAEALREGWYYSGDLGTRDADGYFTIIDRKKNMIISGGENIYAAEVERVLHEHPAVAEAAVIGRSDPKWQEVPVAYVVRKGAVSADEIIRHVEGQLARFKVPREVIFVESLPRNALGKVQHFLLREQDRA